MKQPGEMKLAMAWGREAGRRGRDRRQQAIDWLLAERPPVGTHLGTDASLAAQTGLSHSTVRRLLRDLHREGWIERRLGHGSFVGPRVALGIAPPPNQPRAGVALTRLAVLVHPFGQPDFWYSRLVLEGADQAAVEMGVTIEVIGGARGTSGWAEEVRGVGERLMHSHPDVLVTLSSDPRSLMALCAAARLGIAGIVAGSRLPEIDLPNLHEDSPQGMALAVEHLAAHGHRRIGLAIQQNPNWWAFDRRDGWRDAQQRLGLEGDENLLLWLRDEPPATQARAMAEYLRTVHPTALILGHFALAEALSLLRRDGQLRLPEELSLVVFDQAPEAAMWLGLPVTHVAQPLRQIGRQAAAMAKALATGAKVESPIMFPCSLVDGATVGVHNG